MIFDFVPIQLYTQLYYYFLFFLVIVTNIHTTTKSINSSVIINYNRYFGYLVLLFLLSYMGLRPIHGVFTDMTTYANQFNRHQLGIFDYTDLKDPFFHGFVYLCSKVMTVNMFFLVCATLYILPLYYACKRIFKEHWFYAFLVIISTLTFWSYGVNGIRNGLATSFFIYALSFKKEKNKFIFFVISIAFHKSLLLPLMAYYVYRFLKIRISWFFIFWILAIPLSLIAGGVWEEIFSSLGFDDDRFSYLTTQADEEKFKYTGFRWDFLIFSLLPIIIAYYVIYVKKIKDVFFENIVAVYLLANAFWILIIRANFSNRFAYLSWFLMGLIIAYPFIKHKLIKKQHLRFGIVSLAYFLITFFLNVILKT